MTQIQDPNVQPPENSTPPSPPANPGQSEDWEARFKGLQRTHNTLVQQVAAKDTAIAQLTAQLNDTKSSSAQALTEGETRLGQLNAELTSLKQLIDGEKAEKATLQQQLQKYESSKASRQRLLDAEATDLLPFFEDGDLNIDGLEGDALMAKLTTFRNRITGVASKQFAGASPQTPLPGNSQNPTGMNLEELSDWLNKPENIDSDQYNAFYDTYMELVAPTKK